LRDVCPKAVDSGHSVLLRQPDEQLVMDNGERVRRNDQAAARLASEFGDSSFDFGGRLAVTKAAFRAAFSFALMRA
jgi:hypothetical protein